MSGGVTLDDLIQRNKSKSGPGPARRHPNRSANRAAPYNAAPPNKSAARGHDTLSTAGTKLYVSNLDYGVSAEDIKELFADVGDIKHHMIHFDRSGRSKGTAEVVFSRRQDALAAINRYKNAHLDGRPMRIELVDGGERERERGGRGIGSGPRGRCGGGRGSAEYQNAATAMQIN